MPSNSSIVRQTEDVLEDVLKIIRQEHEGPFPALSEMDRNMYVEEELRIREQLQKANVVESSGNWLGTLGGIFGLHSSQLVKCPEEAQDLLRRVKEDINSKVRARLTGRSSLPPPHIEQSPARSPEQDGGIILAQGNSEPIDPTITSPLIMHPSEPGLSGMSVDRDSSVQNEMSRESGDGDSVSLGRSHRRSRSPTNIAFPSHPGSPPPGPALLASINDLTERIATMTSSIVTDGASGQAQRERQRRIMTSCMKISDSNVDAPTMNFGSTNCSGGVVHKIPGSRPPRHDF